jgi:tRNA dimethylallyltransferase
VDQKKLIPVILGATGVGKSEIAFELALRYGWEIVSVDSRQCYLLMDIGTAKPSVQMRSRVPHHLLDLCPPDHKLSAGEFARHALELFTNLERPLAVGGSGFYLKAIFEPLHANLPHNPLIREELETLPTATLARKLKAEDPVTAEKLHFNDRQRVLRALEVCLAARRPYSELIRESAPSVPVKPIYIGLKLERKILWERQAARLEKMLAAGFLEEVRNLKEMGFSKDIYAFNAYGYRELFDYVGGLAPLAEAKEMILSKIRAFSKRQETFFKTLGEVRWVDAEDSRQCLREVQALLERYLPEYFNS